MGSLDSWACNLDGQGRYYPRRLRRCRSSLRGNSPVLIGGIGVLRNRGHSGSLEILNKWQSTSPSVSKNTQKFNASVDGNLADDGYSMSILARYWVKNCLTVSAPTSICAVGWTSRVTPSEPRHQIPLILVSWPSTHQMNSTPLIPPLPDSYSRKMNPIGLRQIMFLEKLQRLE